MEQLFTNRKFHFYYHRNFRVFFLNGKRPDFPLFLGIFQWEEPTKRVPFTAEPEIPEILTKWKALQVTWQYPMNPNARAKIYSGYHE